MNNVSKDEIKEILKKYGYNTSSFQLLTSGMNYFTSELGVSGIIGYLVVGNVFVCAGDPLCSDDDFFNLVHEFRLFAKRNKKRCLFLQVSENIEKKFRIMGFGSLKFGEEAVIDLNNYTFEGREKRVVRQHASRARNAGVEISLLSSKAEEREISYLSEDWLGGRKTKGFSFLLGLNPLEEKEEKFIFVAKEEGELVGYLTAVPIYARNGFYFEDVIRSIDAPSGTNQLLIQYAIEFLKEKGFSIVTLGTAPLGNLRNDDTAEHKRINNILKYSYEHLNGFYNFKGLYEFKSNFVPSVWEKKYLCFYPEKIKANYFVAIIRAYTGKRLSGLAFSQLKKLATQPMAPLKNIAKPIQNITKPIKKVKIKKPKLKLKK
ncbi:DUF2156 domain-containing protein [Candidatus Woesearchaeota archaeon]|nr:DUF2156 domain-containing protein [Candidatus Woesearchaeota archaeon]